MTGNQRRGISLVEVLLTIPLVAAITTVGFRITTQTLRFQGLVARQIADEARMDDLVRRIKLDAELAETAGIEPSENGMTLLFPKVRYQATAQKVTRTEESVDGSALSYEWMFEHVNIYFTIETLADSPGLVWVTFKTHHANLIAAPIERPCSAAAKIGMRGAS